MQSNLDYASTLNNGTQVTVKLDYYYLGERPQSTPEVTVTLVAEEGPAGGNPLYALTGGKRAVADFLISTGYVSEFTEALAFYMGDAS
jgi:hypothetical protein